MSFNFKVDVGGVTQFNRTFLRLELLVDDLRPIWDDVAGLFYEIERQQFGSQGSFGSTQWAPLKPKYAKWKAKRYPGKPIEQREGALIRSLTSRGAQGNIDRRTARSLELGSSLPYAMAQHGGNQETGLVARNLISIRGDAATRMQKGIQASLINAIRQLGIAVRA